MSSKQGVYYQRILDAEEQCNRMNYKLEREWQRLENRLAVTQVRLERAREIRDEYLDYLQQKYPDWRSGIRKSKELYYDDEMRSETSRTMLTSSISGLSASSNSILDRLATRKYWSDIGSAELVHQVESKNTREQTRESAALKSDIDLIKQRLDSITTELNSSKTARATSNVPNETEASSATEPRSSIHTRPRTEANTVRFTEQEQHLPPKYATTSDYVRQLSHSGENLSNITSDKSPEVPSVHGTTAEMINLQHNARYLERQNLSPEIQRKPSAEPVWQEQHPDPEPVQPEPEPRPKGPRINFGAPTPEAPKTPVEKKDSDIEKYSAFHTTKTEPEPEIPENPLEMLPAAKPYRPLSSGYAAEPTAGYESLVGISRGRAPVASDSESDSLEERINKAVAARAKEPVTAKNIDSSEGNTISSSKPSSSTKLISPTGQTMPAKSPAGHELMAKFYPNQGNAAKSSSEKPQSKVPAYLRKPGDSDSDSDVVIPKKTDSDDDDDFFG